MAWYWAFLLGAFVATMARDFINGWKYVWDEDAGFKLGQRRGEYSLVEIERVVESNEIDSDKFDRQLLIVHYERELEEMPVP